MSESAVFGTFTFTIAAEWDYVKKRHQDEYRQSQYSLPLNQRIDMKQAVSMLLRNGKWKPFAPVTDVSYDAYTEAHTTNPTHKPMFSEYLYFNSHMRRLIYNQTAYNPKKPEEDASKKAEAFATDCAGNGDSVVVLYRDDITEYRLYRYLDGSIIEYILPVSSVELRLYALGIALISIRCQQEKPFNNANQYVNCILKKCYDPLTNRPSVVAVNSQNDIAWIEGAGRRLFPARYVATGDFTYMSSEFPLYSCLYLNDKEPQIPICDLTGMLSKNEKKALAKKDCTPSVTYPERLDFLSGLLCVGCISKSAFIDHPEKKPSEDLLVMDTFNDDRMYLHGTIISQELWQKTAYGWKYRNQSPEASAQSDKKTDAENPPQEPAKDWTSLKPWYGILYGDPNWNSPTCTDRDMLVSLVEQATDARWGNCDGTFGTFHGMTYHSMLMLVNGPVDYLLANNDWHYLQMFLIAVLQRCAIQRFYREASGLLRTHEAQSDKLRSAVQDKYTLFLNQFWFYEVTEQEQGKMMFDRLQKAMNIERDVDFLDKALEEINQQNANKLNNLVNNLLLPLSVIGGLASIVEIGYRVAELYKGICPFTLSAFVRIVISIALVIGFGICFAWYAREHWRYNHFGWKCTGKKKAKKTKR